MSTCSAVRPKPWDFQDHRLYLRAMTEFLKVHERGFSYRVFSKRAGFASPNFLKLVAEGQRNLSAASIPKFAQGLGLTRREAQAFHALVMLSQAKTDDERNTHFSSLRRIASAVEARVLGADQFDLYSTWYAPVVRELAARSDFRSDPEWIARRMSPPITPRQAAEALELLRRLGLLVEGKDGRLEPVARTVTTGLQVQSLAVRNHHRQALARAAETLDELPQEERDVTGLTLSLTREQYAELVERIARFRREILESVDREHDEGQVDTSEAEVHQLLFVMYPLTREPKE